MKTKFLNNLNHFFIISYLFLIYLNLVVTFRPSWNDALGLSFLGIGIVRIVFFLSYPLFFSTLYLFLNRKILSKLDRIYILLVSLISTLFIIGDYMLNFLESHNYANYVYTKYHVYLPYLHEVANLSFLTIIVIVFWFALKVTNRVGNIRAFNILKKPTMVVSIVVILILYEISRGLQTSIFEEIKNIKKLRTINLPYEYMALDLENFAKEMVFVRKNTEDNSAILIPPQTWDYPDVGNQVLVRFFLFPRTLISPKSLKVFTDSNKDCIFYSILAESDLKKGEYFPSVDVDSELIILQKEEKIYFYEKQKYDSNFRETLENVSIGLIKSGKCGL